MTYLFEIYKNFAIKSRIALYIYKLAGQESGY